MKAENLRNPKISLHVPIAAPKLELWALNITGRIYLIAAVYTYNNTNIFITIKKNKVVFKGNLQKSPRNVKLKDKGDLQGDAWHWMPGEQCGVQSHSHQG